MPSAPRFSFAFIYVVTRFVYSMYYICNTVILNALCIGNYRIGAFHDLNPAFSPRSQIIPYPNSGSTGLNLGVREKQHHQDLPQIMTVTPEGQCEDVTVGISIALMKDSALAG